MDDDARLHTGRLGEPDSPDEHKLDEPGSILPTRDRIPLALDQNPKTRISGPGRRGHARRPLAHSSLTEPLLTVPEVAEFLRVRPSTVYAWVAEGRLPCLRLGGRIRFQKESLLRWVTAREEG